MGAWIEISGVIVIAFRADVAPLVGAWIEMLRRWVYDVARASRTPCGCVD